MRIVQCWIIYILTSLREIVGIKEIRGLRALVNSPYLAKSSFPFAPE